MSSNKNSKEKIYDALNRYGHLCVLFLIGIFAFLTRIQGKEDLITDAGQIALLGNDSWYHYRAVKYAINNFPFNIGVDPKSGYPIGAEVGTFGTLYDQIHALAALILGLGNPSDELVRQVLIYASPVWTVVVLAAVYALTKYITESKWAGVTSAGILALIPGTFYYRTVIGFAQHHVLEVLFMVTSVLLIMKALDRAEEDTIVWEIIKERDINAMKPWLKSVGLASFSLLLYYLTWPPSMMMFGLLAIAAVIHTFLTYNSKKPTEPALLTISVLLLTSVVFVLLQDPTMGTNVALPSLLHVGVAGLSLIGTLFLLGLTRYSQANNWDVKMFYGTTIGLGVLTIAIIGVVQQSILVSIFENIVRLLGFPFGLGGESVQTIAEEQSTSIVELSFSQYGLLLITAIAGIVYTFVNNLKKTKQKSSYTFLVLMGVYFVAVSVGTIRFNYYLAAIVAVFSTIMIKQLIEYVGFSGDISSLEGYQTLSIILLLLLIVPILFVPIGGTVFAGEDRVSINSYQDWEEPLTWLSENTDSDGIPSYESVDEKPYNYTNESYGVMSWWDYGHWITVTGDRAPVANPFQQNSEVASEFLLADNPEDAESAVTEMNENAEARYVILDWQTASPFSKFTAMPEFNDNVSTTDLINPYYVSDGTRQQISFFERNQRFYESMSTRLYYAHGSQIEPGPYTVEYITQSQGQQSIRTIIPAQNPVKKHNSTQEAREYAENNSEVSFGGIALSSKEHVPALEQYRLVKSSPKNALRKPAIGGEISQIQSAAEEGDIEILDFDENPSAVKVFERVDGAKITGVGAEPNETISLDVNMIDPATGLSFTYEQDVTATENGEFTAVVPYSTTGYDSVDNPPEVIAQNGYTVRGQESGKVQIADVPEKNVVTEDSDSISIELEPEENVDIPEEPTVGNSTDE